MVGSAAKGLPCTQDVIKDLAGTDPGWAERSGSSSAPLNVLGALPLSATGSEKADDASGPGLLSLFQCLA